MFEAHGFVVAVPLDNFVQVGHQTHNSFAYLCDSFDPFDVDLQKQSYFFLQKRDQEFFERCAWSDDDVVSDDFLVDPSFVLFEAQLDFIDDEDELFVVDLGDVAE